MASTCADVTGDSTIFIRQGGRRAYEDSDHSSWGCQSSYSVVISFMGRCYSAQRRGAS